MSIYLVKQLHRNGGPSRVAAVIAGDSDGALHKSKKAYGGEWAIMWSHPTMEHVKDMVEDSPTEALLLNL